MNIAILFSLISVVLACIAVVFSVLAYTGAGGSKAATKYDPTSYDYMEKCVAQIRKTIDFKPEIALVLGSGLGDISDSIDVKGEISYKDIEGFPVSTAPGHDGKFLFGTIGDKKVICMAGLFALWSLYETDLFSGAVCASGSLWYPGFCDFALNNEFRRISVGVYLSVGDRESAVKNPTLQKTGSVFRTLEEHYKSRGVSSVFELNPGNHYRDVDLRMAKGYRWILSQCRTKA